jgi:putative FmdB family regulatory protein
VPGVLSAPRHHVHSLQAELSASVDEECRLVLVGFDQGQNEIGAHDLEGQPRQSSSRAHVHHSASVAQVVDEHQAVIDQSGIWPGHQPRPLRDHFCERNQLRIVHEMPIYEYRCESCSGKFDVLTRFAERDEAQVCPSCESTKTRVLVSSFAFAGTGDSSSAFEAGGGESAGGCCGGGCGSCGSSPN